MSANVETMFSVRETPWHGLGTVVQEAPNSAEALKLAGLDWHVDQHDVYVDGAVLPGYRANVRDTDGEVLGIVSNQYRVVQNREAFSFTDHLIGDDVRYESAGSLKSGRKIWLLAKMAGHKVAGDDVEPYLCFSNAHDGTGAVKVCMTPVRVVCNNTLNLALKTAKRSWSFRHMGAIEAKIKEARMCLELADEYMDSLNTEAERLANIRVTQDQMWDYLAEVFPVKDDDTDLVKRRVEQAKETFMLCWFAPDLMAFSDTAWAAVNAAADMAAHAKPIRNTKNYQENNFDRIMNGHTLVDTVMNLVSR